MDQGLDYSLLDTTQKRKGVEEGLIYFFLRANDQLDFRHFEMVVPVSWRWKQVEIVFLQ